MSSSSEENKQKTTLVEGQVFENRFQILSVLGQGGVGVVYKAKQTHMNKLVAIKTLMLSVVSHDEGSFRRFEQEAQAASSLGHPNIISIFDFGKTSDGLAYLVMEYLSGQTLDDLIDSDQRLGPDRFLRIAGQICDGLQHAHRKGVVHRDLKPTNIMLIDTEDGQDVVKIVDFGLAKLTAREQEKHLTQTGTIIGTPLYMSPEQCRGMELDHRSDIYSLGCVLYTLLTGQEPIQGNTALDTLYKHTTQAPTPFKQACPEVDLPPRLEQAIMKSLEKEPQDRQQSMMELKNDLTDAIYYRSYHTGIQVPPGTGAPAPIPGASAAPAGAPSERLSRTIDNSNSSLAPSLSAPPAVPGSNLKQTVSNGPSVARGAQGEAGQAPPSAWPNAQQQALRQAELRPKDQLVISKSTLTAGIATLVVLAGALAYAFNASLRKPEEPQPGPGQTAPSQTAAATLAPRPESGQASANSTQAPGAATVAVPVTIPAVSTPKTETSGAHTPKETAKETAKESAKETAKDPAKPKPPQHPAKDSQAEKVKHSQAQANPPAKKLAALPPPITSTRGGKRPGFVETLSDGGQIIGFEKDAYERVQDRDFGGAELLYEHSLALKRKLYGDESHWLFSTLARLVHCEKALKNREKLNTYLPWALRIFTLHGQQSVNLINTGLNAKRNPSGVWKQLGDACRMIARERNDQTYVTWARNFYDLAVNAWKGPTDAREYLKMVEDLQWAMNACQAKPQPPRQKGNPQGDKPKRKEKRWHVGRMQFIDFPGR